MGWLRPLVVFSLVGAAPPVSAGPVEDTEAFLAQLAAETPSVRQVELERRQDRLLLRVEVASERWGDHELPHEVELFIETAHGALLVRLPELSRVDTWVRRPGGPWRLPPRHVIPREPPPKLQSVVPEAARFPYGAALAGKTIAISPGHGYIYYSSLGRYSTQRSNVKWNGCGECRGIVEDFGSHELAVQHLIPLLEGAGARVVLVRDRSYEGTGAVVDTNAAAYQELGGAFQDGANEGGFGGGYRFSTSANAQATYRLTAPVSGPQLLSLWFVAGSNRLADVLVEIQAPGGIRRHRLDQRTHGRRFVPVELLDLPAGASLDLTLSASGASGVLITDAVRLGAGQHSSGHAWWSMGAGPFAAYQAAPAAVQSYGDVAIRPVYAEWFGADAYVSLHSNASGQTNSTAAGTVTYRFNCAQYADHSADPPASACDDPVGSDRLQELVHAELISEVKRDWDPAWVDRGTRVANFGELRELGVIPGILVETAFHDNVQLANGSSLRGTDNQALHDPRFRRLVAAGLYRGLTRFLAGDGPYSLPPPERLVARRVDATSVELDFPPVSGARGYRVEQAIGHRTFDQGRVVEQLPYRAEGLVPDVPVFFRVSTLNEAGAGLPSRVVGAKPSSRRAQLLVVDAFEREDAWVQTRDNQRNTGLIHGLALGEAPFAFDGATEAAWAAGRVSLVGYDGVVLALGRESVEHGVLDPALREAVRAFAAGGGAVFASGSELGWTLDTRGDASTRAFLQEVLGVRLAKDDAAATSVRSAPGALLGAAITAPVGLDDGSAGGVQAYSSDAFTLESGARAELYYGSGGDVAAASLGKGLVLGFALDSLASAAARSALLSTWAESNLDLIPIEPQDGGTPEPDAGPPELGVPGEDAGGEPPTDAGVGPEPDAGLEPLPDAGLPDLGPGRVLVRLYGTQAEPIVGGCRAVEPSSGGALLGLGLALLLRRRRAVRSRPHAPGP